MLDETGLIGTSEPARTTTSQLCAFNQPFKFSFTSMAELLDTQYKKYLPLTLLLHLLQMLILKCLDCLFAIQNSHSNIQHYIDNYFMFVQLLNNER